jgi:hypothetical protein
LAGADPGHITGNTVLTWYCSLTWIRVPTVLSATGGHALLLDVQLDTGLQL